ncbi:hypothetical protein PsorP6_008926 [Peronosclerospora sorghi]|uniref:Uncharacterized protein n=1 Tax=Peronosclerospora sorghi TaxID=230839 RepID=A0ACC0W2L8_9STRA|nr:hypothetical protein PsorP6_008926 [Peronosclerospora sorghi]
MAISSDPFAAVEQLQNIVRTLAPSLSPQVLPKGINYGLDLILSLCKTEKQRETLIALVRRSKPLNEHSDDGTTDKETEDGDYNLKPQVIGTFDVEKRFFLVQKVEWMHERDAVVHEFARFIELQLKSPKAADKVVQHFLEVNGHEPDDIILAQQCFSAAFALQTLLRAFPRLPIAVNGKVVEITDDTDISRVFAPLLALKVKKKKATTAQLQCKSKKRKV